MALVWDTRLRMPERRGEDEGGGVDSFDMLSFEFLSFLSLLGDESNAIRSSDRSYLSDTVSQHDASKVRFEIRSISIGWGRSSSRRRRVLARRSPRLNRSRRRRDDSL